MNDYAQPISLDVYASPTGDVQSFVNGLIDAYDRRSLKARVVRVERERVAEPVFDLDQTDPTVTEDDVLSARIFPRSDAEREKEIFLSEVDTAVEAYADTIIQHARTSYAFSRRALLVVHAVSRTMYRRMSEYVNLFIESLSTRALPVPVYVEEVNDAHNDSNRANDEHYIPTYSAPALETLTYAYNVGIPIVTAEGNNSDGVVHAYNHAHGTDMEYGRQYNAPIEHNDDSFSWALVAECLYTQFRYGPTVKNRE